MNRTLLIGITAISLFFAVPQALAGSCTDHIRISSIANIQTDGGDVLMRAESFVLGSGFSVGGYTAANFPSTAAFRVSAAQNADFKKNSISVLLAAKAAKEIHYLQVSYISPGVFQIEKVSEGASTRGLECTNY